MPTRNAAGQADLVVTGAKVYTLDAEMPGAQAVAMRDGRIVHVGSDVSAEPFIDPARTRVIDAGGRMLLPGFNDAHNHFGPVDPDYIDLRYVADPLEIRDRVRKRVSAAKPGELIRGGRWDHELFPGGAWPTAALLDPVSPDNPVVLERIDGHSVLVNSYVIRRSGITRATPNPPGGEIVKDAASGKPAGIFKESARRLLKTEGVRIERTPEEEEERRIRSWKLAFEMAASLGVTSLQIMELDPPVFADLQKRGLLTARIYACGRLPQKEEEFEMAVELSSQFPRSGDWIRFGSLKVFCDGTLSSTTALLFEPFSDEPDKSGLPQMPYEELERRIVTADRLGFQVAAHAIGDKAIHWVLNACERAKSVNGTSGRRHRIEHASILAPADVPRFAQLGVVASGQPVFLRSDRLYAEKRLGIERCAGVYAWKRLLDGQAAVAFGTDYPVEPLDPREGIYAAVARKDRRGLPDGGWFPDQDLGVEEAIRLYTLGPAYAEFMEDRKGMIKRGYLADLVVLDRDLTLGPPEAILSARVDYTIVGGRVVFQK